MTTSRRLDFEDVFLYAVTPDFSDPSPILAKAERLLDGGVDAMQLRSRSLADRDLIDVGRKLKALCRSRDALMLVNDRPDIALAVEADGVHLGQNDMPVTIARAVLGHRKLIGASCHSLPQALSAQRAGADYVSCGPLWATPTKPGADAVGLGLIGLYRAAIRVPFVAIGGINRGNVDPVVDAGAKRIAVVRGLFDGDDPFGAARFFKSKVVKNQKADVFHSS